MIYRKISAKIILLLLILLPFFSAFPANAALLKVTLKPDYIQINGGGTANLSLNAKYANNNNVGGATIAFTASPAACVPPANSTTDPNGNRTVVFTGPATPPTVVCVIKATVTSGPDSGTASTTIIVGSDYAPLVPIPGIGSPTSFPAYLVGLYELALMSIGIFAMLMILYGGFKYMTSAGNPAMISDAKDAIWSAIFGLILALLSWLILSTVNPELTMIKTPGTTFDPFTASVSTASTTCSSDGNLTSPTCRCIDGVTVGRNPGYDTVPCNQVCSDSTPIVSITGGGGSGATAKVNVVGGVIQNPLTIIMGGSGYTATPTVTITDDSGSGVVVGTVTLTGDAVTNIAITSGGNNYGPTIPDDETYHCLKADAKIGLDHDIPGMTQEESAKIYSIDDAPRGNPIVATDDAKLIIYGGNSVSYLPVNWWRFDIDGNETNGIYLTIVGGAGPWSWFIADYQWYLGKPACVTSVSPAAITCSSVFQVIDIAGNMSTDKVYIRILKPE